MKTFSQFITEATSKTVLDSDKFLDYLNTHCSDFATPWKNGKRIYRGSLETVVSAPYSVSSDSFGGLIIDTTSTERKSAHTTNYYTLFLDYLIKKEHSDFPLRSKSLICTVSEQYAMNFGSGTSVVVIPTNGCKIGEIGASDIWNLNASIGGYKSVKIKDINNQLFNTGFREDLDSIKEKSERYKKIPTAQLQDILSRSPSFFINAIRNNLFESLVSYYTQILKQCKSYTPSNFSVSAMHEVWVGNGDVVVFNSENLKEVDLVVKNGKWAFE